MANTPTLSVSARTNLLSLQRTSELIGRTQERLASGKKVNSAIDDALSYFKARSLDNRASDLATVKDGISQAVNSLKSATDALESVERVLTQMKALADSAKAASDSVSRMTYASQFNDLRSQIDTITADASFGGVNLLKSSPDNLTVRFNERGTNTLQIVGADTTSSTSTGVNVGVASAAVWANIASAAATTTANATIDSAIAYIDSALLTVRTRAQTFGTNSAML
ncbi:MAG: flagellin, partial [Rhodospirillales bacterium]|nr:flagellin [Rhodospirillales bacterium]